MEAKGNCWFVLEFKIKKTQWKVVFLVQDDAQDVNVHGHVALILSLSAKSSGLS